MNVTRRRFMEAFGAMAGTMILPRLGAQAGAEASDKKLGVVLAGLGGYATGQLGPALRQTTHCRLAGVVTGDSAKGKRWAREYGFSERNIWNYETMPRIAEARDVDIVYVVTPPGLHAEHSIAVARAGKHLICEKPMANTVAECDAILAACAKAGVKHGIGYRLFWDPYHTELRRLAKIGEFGVFRRMTGKHSFPMNGWRWRADKKLAGGGPLMDVGIYLVQAAFMARNGEGPVAVTARELPKKRPDIYRDVEETIEWTMEYADGGRAEFSTSYQDSGNFFRAEGQRGWIDFKAGAFAYRVGEVVTSRGRLDYGPSVNQQALQMDGFARHVMGLEANPVPGEMGRRDMQIIEAIYRAAASGKREIL